MRYLILSLLLGISSCLAVVPPISFQELFDQADQVIIARVIEKVDMHDYLIPKNIADSDGAYRAVFRVEAVFKGEPLRDHYDKREISLVLFHPKKPTANGWFSTSFIEVIPMSEQYLLFLNKGLLVGDTRHQNRAIRHVSPVIEGIR